MTPRRPIALVIVVAFAAAACTAPPDARTDRSPTPGRPGTPASPRREATDDRAPCRRPDYEKKKPKPVKRRPLPPVVAEVAREVEAVRGLRFIRPVAPRAVTREELSKLFAQGLDESLPRSESKRVQRAWATIGVIPRGTNLRKAFEEFGATAVAGFYDTVDKRLVFIGTDSPSPLSRQILAHELTHALDDQHFGIDRLDKLNSQCRDELALAYLSMVEGSAEVTSGRWAAENLTPGEIGQALAEQPSGGIPASVPPFFVQLLLFPYPNGTEFVTHLLDEGGAKALNEAFRDPPTSTEQILHPDKYGDDEPRRIDVPDVGAELGRGWKDLYFEDVGEGWLHILFDLRIGPEQARDASEGWDGAQYRAWSRGNDTAIVLDTVWDSEKDAEEFAEGMDQWIGHRVGSVLPGKTHVRVLFASDEETLTRLLRAVASSPVD